MSHNIHDCIPAYMYVSLHLDSNDIAFEVSRKIAKHICLNERVHIWVIPRVVLGRVV